jgi:glycosyltransferase involved in cell wall biosynthesis/GT2 family glycosyltransferase
MKVLRVSHSAVVGAWRERERELRRRGVDVTLLCADVWDEGGRPVRLVPLDGEPVVGVRTWGSHPALFAYDPRPLWRALGEPHDVLDLHEEPFALATAEVLALRAVRRAWDRLRGRRVGPAAPFLVYSAQNLRKRYPVPFRWTERAVLRRAAGAHVCNDDAGRILRGKGATGEVVTIPLGVDLADLTPGRLRPAAHQPDRTIVVGYAGRLASHKGVDVLLRAVIADPRLELLIAGAGPQEEELRRLAAGVGDRVRFAGSLEGPALAEFYRSLDVLAVPSLEMPGWREQFGRVAVEAMACGVPVVASDSGALPDVVGDAGLLVPPGDEAALGAALRRVADEPGLAATLRERGLRVAASCSWPEVARRYHGLYSRVLAGPVARGRAGAAEPPEVVVVAYGAPHLLRQALAPLVGKFPLTVVDNSSLPEIREITELAGGRYLDPGRNGGFAAGVNHALAHRQAPGADVLLLNPDAVVSPDDVAVLQRALHAGPRIASVGPAQVDQVGTPARVVWPYPSPVATWIEAVGLARFRRTPPARSFVVGSVLMLRADALTDVGGLDERFFLYAEETDWAYRANRRGWRHVAVPAARAVHVGGATSTDPARREVHFHASLERFLRKHHGALGWQVARAGAIAGAATRSLVLRGDARHAARRRLRLYLVGPVRAEGRA